MSEATRAKPVARWAVVDDRGVIWEHTCCGAQWIARKIATGDFFGPVEDRGDWRPIWKRIKKSHGLRVTKVEIREVVKP